MKLALLTVIIALVYFSLAPGSVGDPPPPDPTNNPCTNCYGGFTNILPTSVERYGYTIGLQWTNSTQSVITSISWSTNNYPTLCSMVPTSHVCIVSNGIPLQQDNTNAFAHESSIYSNGTNVVAIFWAPNAYSYTLGINFSGIEASGLWIPVSRVAPTNFAKDPNVADPWFPITSSGLVNTNTGRRAFWRLRRNDNGLGWTNVCGL